MPRIRYAKTIQSQDNLEDLVQSIDIVAFKKRAMMAIKEYRNDWREIFSQSSFYSSSISITRLYYQRTQ